MLAIVIGVLSAFSILIVMMRLGIRKFMGYPAICDALVVLMLILMLHGSYVGMVAAVVGGLVFSGMITVIRKLYGYSRLTLKGWKHYDGTLVKHADDIRREYSKSVQILTKIVKEFYDVPETQSRLR